jgi:histidinol-phosphate aminotransferase
MPKPRDEVRTLAEYHPPLGNRDGLRLDFNENTVGCSPRVLERLRRLSGEDLARYPVRDEGERVVAEHLGVPADELLLTNGTDEAIHLICETYIEPPRDALIAVPTFAMFRIYAEAAGARVISIETDRSFRYPTDSILSSTTERTRFIPIANPNNPTGQFVALDEVEEIARAAPHAAILVDEAYSEFCGETMIPRWREFPNIFVSRTFSKVYGLAGLRIGVLMGNKDQMQWLRRASSPYNLNSVALACLPAALADRDYVSEYVQQTMEGRAQLEAELTHWGVRFWPSRANFVLMYLGGNCKPFIQKMRQCGILVRDRSSDYGCKDCVRITVGIREHNDRLLTSMREVFAELDIREKVAR